MPDPADLPSVPVIPGQPQVQEYLEKVKAWVAALDVGTDAASATASGIVELATDAETITGTDTARAITPANLAARIAALTATDTAAGISELATDAEAVTGSATNRVVTPANLTARLAAPGAIGGTTPSTGKFTGVTVGTAAAGAISTQPAVSITRAYTNDVTSGHGYADESTISTNNAALGYNSFDAFTNVGTGTETMEHCAGFQFRHTINLGGISNIHGFHSKPIITAGAAAAVFRHFDARPWTGAGALDDETGFYFDGSSASTSKRSLWSQGASARLIHEGPGVFGSGSYSGVQASAILTLTSTTKGFLPPRMTTVERDAIGTPAEGLVVYDTTQHKLCVRVAAAWETVTSA